MFTSTKGKRQKDVTEFEQKYILTDHLLGEGAYAKVFLATTRSTGTKVAVKIIEKGGLTPKQKKGLLKEVNVLKKLRHDHIVRLYDYYEAADKLFMVMEYIAGNTLFDRLADNEHPLTENEAKRLILTLVKSLKHCKERGVIHRDIKPQNILLTTTDNNAELKLVDFNLSVQVDPSSVDFNILQTMCGTPNYVAPEVISKNPYDYKCDIWSLGVISYLLLSGGYYPFYADDEDPDRARSQLLRRVRRGLWDFEPPEAWENVSQAAKNFLVNVIEKDVERRFTYEQILNHKWIKSGLADDEGCHVIDTRAFLTAKHQEQIETAAVVLRAVDLFKELLEDIIEDEDGESVDEKVPAQESQSKMNRKIGHYPLASDAMLGLNSTYF